MNNKLKINKNKYFDEFQEVIDTPETEIIEENVYVDANFIKNKELIRVDMNIIQFPIFSKNSKRKVNQIIKYYFNKNKDTYITVKPSAGDYIPGELEEKIFIVLMQIMKERNMPQKFVITASELKGRLKLNTGRYNVALKKALLRLSETNYNFKNTMYSSKENGIIKEEVSTPILSLKIITLSLKENKKYRNEINDNRIKEIYEVTISDHFYTNIIQKGYMVYNGNTLLEIESSTARTIYMLVEKLRFDNLSLKLDTIFLIKRIPLKYDKRNLTQTIKLLEKSLQELIDKNLIVSFKFIKEKTWEKSEIEIFFHEVSVIEKQKRFYDDRNDFRKIMAATEMSKTTHEMIEEVEVIEHEKIKDIKITKNVIDKIINLMPSKAKELKTMPKSVKEAIEKYGYEKVEKTAIYMKKNKVEKVRAYFLKALENDWVEDDEIMPPKLDRIAIKEPQLDFGINIPQYDESLYIEFEKLSIEVQNGIETYAYRDYIKKCGIETKIQQLAFMGSRKKYICEYLERYPEILGKKEKKIEETKEIEKIYFEDMGYLKAYIDEYIINLTMFLEEKNIIVVELRKKIIVKLLPLFMEKKLTKDKVNETINEILI